MYSVLLYWNCDSSDICHLLKSGVGVKIATDILCESVGYHIKLPVSHKNYRLCSRLSWTVCKWEVPHCMKV